MKRVGYVLLTLMVSACQYIQLDDVEVAESKKFTFTVKGDFLSPEFTRAAMTADGVEMTDLWVVDVVKTSADAGGTVVQMLHQTPSDADWGAPKMTLTLGTHHVMFLASRGQGAQYADGVVMWEKPLDTFYLDYEVTVVKTSNGNRSVTLNRVATKLQLVISDAIPSGTTSIEIAPDTWFCGWDMIRGVPVSAGAGYSVLFNIPSSWWNRAGGSLSAWSLSGSEEWTTNVAIVSKVGAVENASALITDAPFLANRATIYRGNLYASAETSAVLLKDDWQQSYEGVY